MSLALCFWLGSCICCQGKSTSAALRPGLVPVCGARAGGKLGRVQTQCVRVGLKVKKAAVQYENSGLLHATRLGQCVCTWGGQKLDCGTSVWLVVLYECVHRNQSVYFEVIIKCANKLPEVRDDFVFADNFCIKLQNFSFNNSNGKCCSSVNSAGGSVVRSAHGFVGSPHNVFQGVCCKMDI